MNINKNYFAKPELRYVKGNIKEMRPFWDKYKKEIHNSAFLRSQLRDIISPQLTPKYNYKYKIKTPIHVSSNKLTLLGNFVVSAKAITPDPKRSKPKEIKKIVLPCLNEEQPMSSIYENNFLY